MRRTSHRLSSRRPVRLVPTPRPSRRQKQCHRRRRRRRRRKHDMIHHLKNIYHNICQLIDFTSTPLLPYHSTSTKTSPQTTFLPHANPPLQSNLLIDDMKRRIPLLLLYWQLQPAQPASGSPALEAQMLRIARRFREFVCVSEESFLFANLTGEVLPGVNYVRDQRSLPHLSASRKRKEACGHLVLRRDGWRAGCLGGSCRVSTYGEF